LRPLANRVDPFGALFATGERGGLMGNRGGRFHDPASQSVRGRSYTTKQWITCRLSFKNRRRTVWGRGYTELFFCDEVSALAAGHRPCFECRREAAVAFAAAWGRAHGMPPPRAPEMDAVLHGERLEGMAGRQDFLASRGENLPDAAMIAIDDTCYAVDGPMLRRWSFMGFGPPEPAPPAGTARVLTPPSIIHCLSAGYRPAWRRLEGRPGQPPPA
jgi:hypothetical protein